MSRRFLTLAIILLAASRCASVAKAQHRLLVQGNDKLAIVDRAGKIEWQMPWGGIHDVAVLPNGHIMVPRKGE